MREIVVVSGKGGTGKTTVCAGFALLDGTKILVDADVDAPDLHILLKPRILEAYSFVGSEVAVIDRSRCTGCGECRRMCRFSAITEDFEVNPRLCEGCGLCFHVCQYSAVSMRKKESGVWFLAETKAGLLLHARLHPGEENSGKLVSELKRRAREIAESEGLEILLVDGPPGIGCPVISALTGASDVVFVTEPTPFGIHDLERVYELARYFSPKMWLVINKFDLSPEGTKELEYWAEKRGVDLLGRIPFDPQIPRLQEEALSPVEVADSLTGGLIKEIWEKLVEVRS